MSRSFKGVPAKENHFKTNLQSLQDCSVKKAKFGEKPHSEDSFF